MLDNDPPPGTRVRFVREVRMAKIASTATLKGPVRKYLKESADDEFRVSFQDQEIIVKRSDIEKI